MRVTKRKRAGAYDGNFKTEAYESNFPGQQCDFGFSFVQGISHRDDAMALCFFCELAREEKHEAMTSKTLSLALNKRVFSVFVTTNKYFLCPALDFP